MKRSRERRCCCKEFFSPDYRNVTRQDYGQKPGCRKASKTASQRKWTRENLGYFRDPVHVGRVRDWRSANPRYTACMAGKSVLFTTAIDAINTLFSRPRRPAASRRSSRNTSPPRY